MNNDTRALPDAHDMSGSTFVRLKGGVWDPPGVERVYFFEIEPGGHVPREIIFDSSGAAIYVTHPQAYPIADYPTPPGSAIFEQQFGSGEQISKAEFVAAHEQAVAELRADLE